MKFTKMLGLLAVAAAAMMAFAGIASADIATSPHGTLYTGKIAASNENGHVSLHGSNGVTIECEGKVEGTITGHGAGKPVTGPISALSFPNCTNGVVTHVKENGTLSASATGSGGNASLSSSGARVEVTASSIFGTITCIYTTNATSLGTLTGSTTTGKTATLDISATIPRTGGSALCGSSGNWTGSYSVTTPDNLNIDKT